MKTQQGMTLIEVLLVLIIVVALTLFAFIVYPRVNASKMAYNQSQILSTALSQIHGMYQTGIYMNLNSTSAAKSDFLPENFIIDASTGQLVNDFGDGVTPNTFIFGSDVSGVPNNTPAARFITISYGQIPSGVCLKLATALTANWKRVAVNGNVIYNKLDASQGNDIIDNTILADSCAETQTENIILITTQ